MKIETLSERIANAENKIGKKQLTIAKKKALIDKKQQLIEAKGLANSDSSEALTLKWDIEHYTGDISRLEREITETALPLIITENSSQGLWSVSAYSLRICPMYLNNPKKNLENTKISGISDLEKQYDNTLIKYNKAEHHI